ncbi:MAG: M48 family metalloprotease, partial [candidate division KSB1 bacterium]|nr:M48 family metalloprotease [candidate division KSB1 bacterium]
GDLAQAGVGLLFLKFSRDQESESDRLGVEYSTRIGYDAHHMSRFFRTISRITEQAGGGPPTFLSTHPNPENREHTVAQLANEWQQKIPGPKGGTSRSAYLRKIEGLVYGEDPRQGFVEGGYFYHPELRFQFVVPAKWQVANQPTRVVMVNPEQNAAIQFSLGKGTNPQQAAETFVSQAKATVLQNQAIRVNNMPAYMLVTNVQSQQGVLRLLSYFIQKEDKIYVFHGYTSSSLFDRVAPTFEQVMKSFDQLRNQAALNKQPQRVRILQVNQPGDLRQTLKSFGVKEEDLEELAILNGMLLEDKLQRGDVVKVVR